MQLAKASFDMPHQSLALWRQADVAAFTLEQHSAEILFKAADGMTYRTRRQAEVIAARPNDPVRVAASKARRAVR